MHEVVITGIGLRTPFGNTLDDVRAGFANGVPVIRAVEGPKGRKRAFATLREDLSTQFSRIDQLMLDPLAQMAVLASDDLIRDSGLQLDQVDRDRFGVFLGTGQGARHTTWDSFVMVVLKDTIKKFSILRGLDNAPANHVSIRHGLRGESHTTVLACSSSNSAIGQAYRLIRAGELDGAIAGGVEATFSEGVVRAWEAMGVLAKFEPGGEATSCKPFSKNRTGLVLGEGAVLFTLEAESHARARGARIYARIAGYGASSDAHNMAHPDASGQVLALNACLRSGGLAPADIGYINAHGTATPTGDPVEVAAIRQVFGSYAEQIPVSATKSLHGHLLGAAGAIELLAVILALKEGLIAPTANLDEADPVCDLDFVPGTARHGVDVRAALSNSFAFGGSNACLALTRV